MSSRPESDFARLEQLLREADKRAEQERRRAQEADESSLPWRSSRFLFLPNYRLVTSITNSSCVYLDGVLFEHVRSLDLPQYHQRMLRPADEGTPNPQRPQR
jgi:hypothetical protein